MRFLTIFFMIVYGWRLVFKQKTFIDLCNKICKNKTSEGIDSIIKNGLKSNNADVTTLLIMTGFMLIISVIQIFYVLFAFKSCNITIWCIYVILMIVNLLVVKIKGKLRREATVKPIKYTGRTFLIHSINLIFFVYMFFILFIF
ncbi:hypothetical protein [Clostridium perfringens]|uniref:hypothetical protein n=1 Tax=Clostridium perfringens TaxID=1502 RepID=UPI0023408182|nr:hypothetical protein [Clostridium perfringens]MDC4245654.1 hypothetical protein [Clostridium perfringens]